MSTTALLNATVRVIAAVLYFTAAIVASAVLGPPRYELVNVTPRATIVFDRYTGEAEQRAPLPLFSEPREQPRPF